MQPTERKALIDTKSVFISCVVPVYNEEANVQRFLLQLHACLKQLTERFEIIVIDDGSKDKTVENILDSLGRVIETPEENLDAVTAVSGSGPAYLFEFAAAFRAAALATGLPPATAELLARETILGAAKLLESTGEDPEKLRDAVTSPGGTTEAALKVLRTGNFRGLFRDAVVAAQRRSEELAKL